MNHRKSAAARDAQPHVAVTGAVGGIGRSITEKLVAEGYAVTALDICRPAEPLADVEYVECDITDPEAFGRALDDATGAKGALVGLAHAAGILFAGTVEHVTPEQAHELLRVNTLGVFTVLRDVAPRLARSGGGSVVVITSNSARTPRVELAMYGASKAGAEMLAKSVGLEYARQGVRVSCVAPGSTRTTMLGHATGGADPVAAAIAGEFDDFRLGIPLGRVAEPGDVAGVVAFLLSEESRHITMETVTVDGGAGLGA